jgi:hypothetical protein
MTQEMATQMAFNPPHYKLVDLASVAHGQTHFFGVVLCVKMYVRTVLKLLYQVA